MPALVTFEDFQKRLAWYTVLYPDLEMSEFDNDELCPESIPVVPSTPNEAMPLLPEVEPLVPLVHELSSPEVEPSVPSVYELFSSDVSDLFTSAPSFDFVRHPTIDLVYRVAWAAGRRRRRPKKRGGNKRGRGGTGLERQMLDYLRITAPAVAPSLRDVPFPSNRKSQIFVIRRGYDAGTVTTANGAPATGVIAPTLSLFPDFTDFTNLFDAYRFECVRVTFTPVQNNVLSASSRLYTVIDYDDSNVLPSLTAAQEYDTLMVSTIDNTSAVTRVFRPRFAMAAYSGVFTSFAQSSRNQWLDVASATVPNYGLKWIVDPDNAIKIVYKVDVVACIKFKCVR